MSPHFVQVDGEQFKVNGQNIVFRGFGLGTWMNLEHFMIGFPGTDTMIKKAFGEVYGAERSKQFFDRFLMEFVDEQDFELLKSLGVNALRLPFNYKYFIDDQNPSVVKQEGFKYLDHVISLCEKYEIYAILDLHTVPGGQNPDWHCDTACGLPLFWSYAALRDTVVNLWANIAEHYRGNPWVAAYDIVNEPSLVTDAVVFNEFYDEVVRAIRKVDADHIIFVEGNKFTTDFSMVEPIEDPQVAYTFHYYPFVDEPQVLSPSMSKADRKRILNDCFLKLVRIRDKYKRPVWCGELGLVLDQQGIDFQVEFIEDMLGLCEEHDVSWTLWTYKDTACMGLVYPKEDMPWRKLAAEIKQVWDQQQEQAMGEVLVDYMAETYFKPISKEERYPLQFRMRTIMQAVCVEQNLKPFLEKTPWERMLELPASFHYENCEYWPELAQVIKKFTGMGA